MNATALVDANATSDLDALDTIADRVLWLSTSMVHHANRVRPNASGLKVGGHQASSASMVAICVALAISAKAVMRSMVASACLAPKSAKLWA